MAEEQKPTTQIDGIDNINTLESVATPQDKAKQFAVTPVPFHMHNGTDSSAIDYTDQENRTRYILYRIIAPTVDVAVANAVGGDVVMPFGGYFDVNASTPIGATVDTAGTTGTMTIDVRKKPETGGALASIFTTNKITITTGSKTSRVTSTGAPNTQAGISTKPFMKGDILNFDISAIHSTPAKGCTMFIRVVETST